MANDTTIWKNLRTSSTNLCKPIKIEFSIENEKVIKEELSKMKEYIEHLKPTKIRDIAVHYQ